MCIMCVLHAQRTEKYIKNLGTKFLGSRTSSFLVLEVEPMFQSHIDSLDFGNQSFLQVSHLIT